nr:MAG TPA_asm: hypothetical protein [Caudoviricetes sp.]
MLYHSFWLLCYLVVAIITKLISMMLFSLTPLMKFFDLLNF